MKKIRQISLLLITLMILSFLTGCSDDGERKVIENMKLNETIEVFKDEVDFVFASKENEEGKSVISGFSPEGMGNTIIEFIGDLEEDIIENIHFTYYMPEDMSNPEGDHLYNSIYLNLMLAKLPETEKVEEWLFPHIQNIDDVEKTVDEETIIDGNHIHVLVGGDEHRKLELKIQNESQK